LLIQQNLTLVLSLSSVITLILGGVSLASILLKNKIYPTEAYLQAFVPTDVARLFIGFPILASAMVLTCKGHLTGLLTWPGVLLYVLYSSLIYIFALPLSWIFLLQLILVMLSVYTLMALITNIDRQAAKHRLSGNLPEKICGGILIGLGVPFLLLAASIMIQAINNPASLSTPELALQMADFLVTPTWIIGGVPLWRRRATGYVIGAGLLFQASMLMVSLLVIILIKPLLTPDPFVLIDFTAVFLFGMICFVPLTLFVRGILSSQPPEQI
jgi:hypothetical protein